MSTEAKRRAAEAQLSALPQPGGEAGWARAARARARSRFLDAGAPVRRDEYWKYTDPGRLTAPMALAAVAETAVPTPALFDDAVAARFVNGRFRPDLSDELGAPGLAVSTLGEVLAQDISIMRELFGVLEAAGQEKVARPLAALNTASATEGLALQATGGGGAIELRYDQIGEGASLVRHLIRVEAGAALTVVETGVVTNSVMEVDVAEGAAFHHVRLQADAEAPRATHLFARLGRGAALKSFTLTADGALTRNEIVVELAGPDALGHVAGVVLAERKSHVDNTVFVTHGGVGGESRQVFKNVLGGTARGIFQGKIFVRQGAQKTDGYQISQAVLLSDGAEFSAKPELEIYADDVACSHGSTTGALDETALFYLRSRGVPRAEAETLLVAAFADEAIAEIADARLAERMRAEVETWVRRRG